MRRALFTVLVLTLLLPAPSFAGTLLVVGDSLSAAYGIDVQSGWVTLLQQRLDAQGSRYKVVNASISGDTTAGGLARLPQALAAQRPEIVIIELGGNDGLRGLPLTQMKNNIAAMITKARAQGARVLLVGIYLPPNYGRQYLERFRAVYRDLAAQYSVPLVPFLLDGVATQSNLMQADGIHPTAEAQPTILENIWSHLRPLL